MSTIKIGMFASEIVPPEKPNNGKEERKVELISKTEDPLYTIYRAGKISIGQDVQFRPSNKTMINFIKRLIKRKHLSVLEHASFTFLVKGISRITSHQWVRHRIASYTQESQRYSLVESQYYIPESLKTNKQVRRYIEDGYKLYKNLFENGVMKQDARYVLPQSYTTKLIVTMNLRELLHFFKLRLHKSAQHEIREAAEEMLEILIDILGFNPMEVYEGE